MSKYTIQLDNAVLSSLPYITFNADEILLNLERFEKVAGTYFEKKGSWIATFPSWTEALLYYGAVLGLKDVQAYLVRDQEEADGDGDYSVITSRKIVEFKKEVVGDLDYFADLHHKR